MKQGKSNIILVTGGAGFIGSHLVDELLSHGYEVVVVDNFSDFYNPAFKEKNIRRHESNKKFHLCRGSVTDMDFLRPIFKMHVFDTIVHLAASAGVRPSIENPALYYETNVRGTLNLLELARAHNIRNFIFSSSSSVYGNSSRAPFSEDESADRHLSPYGATKRACELLTHTYHVLYAMNCINLRFFTVYGERGRPDMAPYLFVDALFNGKKIKKFGDGSSVKRDYTYVGDVVNGIMKCLDKNLGYEIINLGNSAPVTLDEFISTLEDITGKKANIELCSSQPGDVLLTFADVRKAEKLLGWKPNISLRNGLGKLVEWYKAERFQQS